MNRRLEKYEVKGIRECLGLTQRQWSEMLGMSLVNYKRVEQTGDYAINVSDSLDTKVKRKLKELNQDIDQLLEVVHARPKNGGSN
ncbi:hypothetical protein J2Y03_001194 [Neobacillus niacini]|uniref:hypothetical protein n=1 Tax=Neobacillus niacini TaxID=86668 RepID=UPI0028583571|nr:hypothetical protein [Neobacillus niacini]MDR7076191.1 hypothetical protein [Neobacillus niacini]